MALKKYALRIQNFSKLGCTVTKGFSIIKKHLSGTEVLPGAAVMDFGGSDCDFNWKEISERPSGEHLPHTPLSVFADTYKKIINLLKERGVLPIITTLPPLDAEKFFCWFCGSLNTENILDWLHGVETIYRWQEMYSRAVERIAADNNTLLVDLRGAFLVRRDLDKLLCEDGTHPNTEGQKVITAAFMDFIENAKATDAILA